MAMSLLQGTEHAFSFNFILSRELVMTVNIHVQEVPLKAGNVTYQDGRIAVVATVRYMT